MSRNNLYVGDNTVLTNLVDGQMMFVDTRDPVNISIILTGKWEEWIANLFKSILKPGMTVIDIGAHHGYFSLLAGSLVGTTGAVHSFEPNPFHHRNFLKTMCVNGLSGHVNLHRVALGSEPGIANIVTLGEAGSSIHFVGLDAITPPTHITAVKGVLKDYLPSPKVDVIKIDIDGEEPNIMSSVFEIIDQNGSMYIFLEYLPSIWSIPDPYPILEQFAYRGFTFFNLTRDGQVLPISITELAHFRESVQLDLMLVR